jgi:hypothetical protein
LSALKDQRYRAIKSLIQSKGFNGLKDVFTIIPLSTVRQDMQINYNTLRRRVDSGDTLTVKDIIDMAELFEVEPVEVFKLTLNDINSKKRIKKR